MTICTYIDGESHYIRSDEAWKRKEQDQHASLEGTKLNYAGEKIPNLVLPKAKVFWHKANSAYQSDPKSTVYFTSIVGNEETLFDARKALREYGVEPHVVLERRDLANQREVRRTTDNLIEKPKTVDAALAVRVLEDAYNNIFDVCRLFTSDVDILPVVEALRRKGKIVEVHGYKDGLGDRSPLYYVPDQFIDLDKTLIRRCVKPVL